MANRILKFRAWDKLSSGGMMLPWEQISKWDCTMNDLFNDGQYELMQFTGLTDKEGKEIYEGDILRTYEDSSWEGDEGNVNVYNVVWGDDYPAFTLKGYMDVEYNSLQHVTLVASCEVIGNIYENPELLTP